MRDNKRMLVDAESSGHLVPHEATTFRHRPCVVKLDYAALFGRRYLTFGSSRRSDFRFPKGVGVGATHFLLHFEMHTAVLLLTDRSPNGTWVSSHPTQGFKRLHQATYPLLQTLYIRIGQQQCYGFQVTVAPYMKDMPAFINLFNAYAQSIDRSTPGFVQDLKSIGIPLVTLDEKFINLHRVGQSKFEMVHTCLRVADGRLFAVKQLTYSTLEHGKPMGVARQQEALRETSLLSSIRHVCSASSPPGEKLLTWQPNIVRFIDHVSMPHTTFLVMNFVPYGSLADLLNESKSEKLEDGTVQALARQSLHAIQFLHSQEISHRNIRPESFLVRSQEPYNFQLCNFSHAERFLSEMRTPCSFGTEDSFGMDIWALGVVILAACGCWSQGQWGLWESAVGNRSSSPITLPDFRHLPCVTLLNGMLQSDPQLRYSADDCLRDPWLQQEQIRKRQGSVLAEDDMRSIKRIRTSMGEDSAAENLNNEGPTSSENQATSE